MDFLLASVSPPARILDLGTRNPFTERLEKNGFEVVNTTGDLDVDYEGLTANRVDLVTAFEILEHLVSPFNVLRALPADRLMATVPLRLWFAKAYRDPVDEWDRHFHEFEDWQFDWLLAKAGWEIVRTEKWKSPVPRIGVRPLLRLMTNRYYAVEAVRRSDVSSTSLE